MWSGLGAGAVCCPQPRVRLSPGWPASSATTPGPQDPELEWEAGWGWRQTRFLGHVWTHSPARPARGGVQELGQHPLLTFKADLGTVMDVSRDLLLC